MSRVSIILPLYKSKRYVCETVESVLAQTHRDWELVVVDDGSPDDSGDVVRSYADSRITVYTRDNSGPCRSRNFGISKATGKFIGFIDHDDIWHPEKLEKHLAHLNRSPQVGVSYGPSELIGVDGSSLGIFQTPKLKHIDAREILCRNPVGNGSVPIIRRQLLEAVKFRVNRDGNEEWMYFDDEVAGWEDVELWLRMATTTEWKFEGIPECLSKYRIVPDSIAGSPEAKQAAFERGVERVRSYAPVLIDKHLRAARAYHLRFLARRLIEAGDGRGAVAYVNRSIGAWPRILLEDTRRTIVSVGGAYALLLLPKFVYGAAKDAVVSLEAKRQMRALKR